MSSLKVGEDCCGDRYDVDSSFKCTCGCELCYCLSCYREHQLALFALLKKEFGMAYLRRKFVPEIRKQRKEYPDAVFKLDV